MKISKANTVLVLDLDDTLYKEADYVISGIKHIASLILRIKNVNLLDELLDFHHEKPEGDFLDLACEIANLPLLIKESLLWSYRTHYPDIKLNDKTRIWLSKSKTEYHSIVVLTDGRSVTQRLKLSALSILDIPAYISEEWDSEKPDPKRFLAIQEKIIASNYIYIGDNIEKDFIAPRKLGWITIGLKNDGRNIHSQHLTKDTYSPEYWIDNIAETDIITDQT